jgi:hypothetical protein
VVGHVRQSREDIFQVSVWVKVPSSTAFNQGIDN